MSYPIEIVECDECGHWHRVDYTGDCRNDDERFTDPQDAATRLNRTTVMVDEEGLLGDCFKPNEKRW